MGCQVQAVYPSVFLASQALTEGPQELGTLFSCQSTMKARAQETALQI